jgi:hypothetical protein
MIFNPFGFLPPLLSQAEPRKRPRLEEYMHLPPEIWLHVWEFAGTSQDYVSIRLLFKALDDDTLWKRALRNHEFRTSFPFRETQKRGSFRHVSWLRLSMRDQLSVGEEAYNFITRKKDPWDPAEDLIKIRKITELSVDRMLCNWVVFLGFENLTRLETYGDVGKFELIPKCLQHKVSKRIGYTVNLDGSWLSKLEQLVVGHKEIHPEELKHLKNLKRLGLHNWKWPITYKLFEDLPNLMALGTHGCMWASAMHFPDGRNIRELDISSCGIQGWGFLIDFVSLTRLYVYTGRPFNWDIVPCLSSKLENLIVHNIRGEWNNVAKLNGSDLPRSLRKMSIHLKECLKFDANVLPANLELIEIDRCTIEMILALGYEIREQKRRIKFWGIVDPVYSQKVGTAGELLVKTRDLGRDVIELDLLIESMRYRDLCFEELGARYGSEWHWTFTYTKPGTVTEFLMNKEADILSFGS